MSECVVETTALRKEYTPQRGQRVLAVAGLDLSVHTGTVHALLGPDGAGKTTVLRMLLGLTSATSGAIRLFGDEVPKALPGLAHRVGAWVGGPAFSSAFTGRLNLELLAGAAGLGSDRVDTVLDQVGLATQGSLRYAGYSAGNRRRLALAAALLRESDLLVLDEPTRGFDPGSAAEIRRLLVGLADQGRTILLATSDVSEVQQTCDSVTMLAEGTVLAEGSVARLLGEARSRTRVGVAEPERAAHLLTGAGYVVTREADGDGLLVRGHERPDEISRALAAHGVYVEELTVIRPDLEQLFAQLDQERRTAQQEPA